MGATSLTGQLARQLVTGRERGLPAASIAAAPTYVIDWLGSALAGAPTEAGGMLVEHARQRPEGTASVVGTGLRCSPEVAAFVNGGLSHIVEMDDLHRASVLHPGAVVIPAALAAAETTNARGDDLLSAVVAGYEVAIRIGEAVGKRHYRYFHNTSTCGVFGAAAAAGWLLGLNADELVWAFGNAGTQACGLWEFNADGAMSKHLHAGRAAAAGLVAAELGGRGFTGARQILEGKRGFFAATAPDAEPERVIEGLDGWAEDPRISGVSIKPHSSCRHTHAGIDAALDLRPQISGQQLDAIEVGTYQAALDLCDNPEPEDPYAAKFSLQYCIAAALTRGHVSPADFSPVSIADPAVRLLLPNVSVHAEPEFETLYPREWPVRLRLRSTSGDSWDRHVSSPKGDPENPLSDGELETKFRQLATSGGHETAASGFLQWARGLTAGGAVAPPQAS
ncbi:MAG TPA: MmgE/PrpD family protein [Acidobacteriota bacterium]|nr:MmgE/PrpD family protein [Acidobacteriota bacterium]